MEKVLCVCGRFVVDVVLNYTSTWVGRHAGCRDFISVSGGWMLLRKELIMAAKDSFHTTMQGHNTIQLYCFCVEKFAFWLVIYIKTFNKINNKTS